MKTPQLIHFFTSRRYTATRGMNWLQERGHISDLCIAVDDVAPIDSERVFRLAGVLWCLTSKQKGNA